MIRRISRFLSVLSTLLLAFVCVLWVRSYFAHERVHWEGDMSTVKFTSADNRAVFSASWRPLSAGGRVFYEKGLDYYRGDQRFDVRFAITGPYSSSVLGQLGFYLDPDVYIGAGFYRMELMLPYWFMAMLFAIAPVVRYVFRGRTVQAPGYCPKCRYDLRATPDRCPECGWIPSQPASQPS